MTGWGQRLGNPPTSPRSFLREPPMADGERLPHCLSQTCFCSVSSLGVGWALGASVGMGRGEGGRCSGADSCHSPVAAWPHGGASGRVRLAGRSRAHRLLCPVPQALGQGAGARGGAAGWCERRLLASRSVLGPFSAPGSAKEQGPGRPCGKRQADVEGSRDLSFSSTLN